MKNLNQLVCIFLIITISSVFGQSCKTKNACSSSCSDSKYSIAFSSDREDSANIFLSDLSGKNLKRITDVKLRNGYPAYSPDGKKIALYGYEDGGKTWSIYVMNSDGTDKKRLTHTKFVYDTSPRWSLDGKKIVFDRSTSDWKTSEIWVMNADGSNLKVVPNINGLTPSFTKDGNIIYYTDWQKDGEICISDLEGNILKKLTNNNYSDQKPDISPDGSKVVFSSERDGNSEIYVMNIDGSGQINLTNHPGNDGGPRWSPDGSNIIFVSKRDGNYEIYLMNADGSGLKNVTNNKANDIQPTWIIK